MFQTEIYGKKKMIFVVQKTEWLLTKFYFLLKIPAKNKVMKFCNFICYMPSGCDI